MPYNPGNQNIAGQLLGQGILQAAQSLSSGYVERAKQQEQDRIFESQSKSTENLIKAYLPKDAQGEILALNPNETPAARHARLTGTVENFVLGNKLKQFQSEQAAQERANLKAKMLSQFAGGAGVGFYSNASQKQMQDELATPTGQFIRQSYDYTGKAPSGADIADLMKAQIAAGSKGPEKQIDPTSYRGVDSSGKPIEITVDRFTGKEIGRGPIQQPPIPPEIPNPMVLEQYKDLSLERKEKVMPALATRAAYRTIKPLVNSQDMISGISGKLELGLRKLVKAFGGQDDPKVSATEIVRSQLAIPLMAQIKSLGSGTSITDTDRDFIAAVVGQDITLDATTIKKLVDIGEQVSDDVVNNYQERLDSTFSEDSKDSQFKQARNSLRIPNRQAPSKTTANPLAGKTTAELEEELATLKKKNP